MGRPKLTDDERREKPLRIRLKPDERELVDKAAESNGTTASGWARNVLVQAAIATKSPKLSGKRRRR